MPAIDANRSASRVAVRKTKPKRKAAPKVKVRVPSKAQVRNAQAQQRQYVSQGKAVKKAAKSQQVVARAKAQERAYVSQGKAVAKVAPQQAKANRVAYLRRTRPTGMKLAEEVAGKLIRGSTIPSTGGGPNLGGRGNLPFSKVKTNSSVATALAPKPVTIGKGKIGKLAGNLTKDAITFPAQAISSTYDVGAGVVEAAQGHPQRLKRTVKGFKQSDPVYNAVAAGVEAAKGNTKAAKSHLDKAGKAIEQHPGLAAAEVFGLKGGVGRTGGKVMRTGVAGKAAKRVASTERAPLKVPNTRIEQQRTYSRDVLTKAGQVAHEKVQRKRVVRRTQKAVHAEQQGQVEKAAALRQTAARINPDRLSEAEIKRQVDERVAANEDVRRFHRAKVTANVHKILKPAKHEGHAVSVVAQRITKASTSDLRAYIGELKAEHPNLSPSQKRANKTLRRELQKVVDNPKADMGALEKVAQDYHALTHPLQRKLVKRGLLAAGQADRAKLIPYAVRNMGARNDKALGLVDKTGAPLPTEKIVAHMEANNVKPAAFITQAPNQRGGRNFNIRGERAVTISTRRRTGAATLQGTLDAHPETLVEGAARAQGLVDATEGFRRTIKDFGHRTSGKLTTFKTFDQARQAAADMLHDEHGNPIAGTHPMRPVRLNPVGASKQQLDSLLSEVDTLDHGHAEKITSGMRAALNGEPGPGKWALIPDAAANRMLEHLNAQGGGGSVKTLQLANQAFRKTVLATSPTWFAGNLIEGIGRAALERAGPRSYVHGKRVLARAMEISPKAGEEAMSRIVSGGHYGSADKTHIRVGAEQFSGTKLAPLATALGKFWRTPGPKQAAHAWNTYTQWVFNTVNGAAESKIQTAMFGRALLNAGQKATDDAAKGLTNTPAQIRFGREVDRMYGRYGKRSPAERKFFATYTPFAPWAINATYFVYRTLPRDHPVATAVIAASEQATEEWRTQHGLDQFMKGALPSFLQGSIPTKGGGHFRAARYTPFGAFGSPSETLAGQVLPLWTGALAALKGQDWKGRNLTVKDSGATRPANELERFVFAARALAEATVPIYSTAARVKAGGPAALNPFKVIKPKKASTGGRAKSNPYAPSGSNPYAPLGGSNPYAP